MLNFFIPNKDVIDKNVILKTSCLDNHIKGDRILPLILERPIHITLVAIRQCIYYSTWFKIDFIEN